MKIKKTKNNSKLTLKVTGRIDTSTAPELVAAVEIDGVDEIVFDIAEVDYISSAGLRVFLATQQQMEAKDGKMIIAGAQQIVMEIFDIAGLTDAFNFA